MNAATIEEAREQVLSGMLCNTFLINYGVQLKASVVEGSETFILNECYKCKITFSVPGYSEVVTTEELTFSVDSVVPVVKSVSVNGKVMEVTFSESLSHAPLMKNGFTVFCVRVSLC